MDLCQILHKMTMEFVFLVCFYFMISLRFCYNKGKHNRISPRYNGSDFSAWQMAS